MSDLPRTSPELKRETLENEQLFISLIPELGAKINVIKRKKKDFNILLEPPDFPYRSANFGDSFEKFDTSGFDECFPTVSECQSPDDQSLTYPDHGDLWSLPAKISKSENSLVAEIKGKSFDYLFSKKLSLFKSTLRIDYEVVSNSKNQFQVAWSSHPLLKASEGSEIFFPPEVKSLFLNWSALNRLGNFGEEISWPSHERQKLSEIGKKSCGFAEKFFAGPLKFGWSAFYNKEADEHVVFRFPPKEVPYVGLWVCQGGWPLSRASKHFTVAVEPCSGMPDSLLEASKRNSASTIRPGRKLNWWLELSLGSGIPEFCEK
ncbi:MAG: hypothetical protein HQM08_26100 [Candidatus Riflebacteria bacterium]|nr:hypothetical protein [Candidatus Riflebacteria bacterium]